LVEGGYRFEEHTADVVIVAWGETLEKAFEKAGEAVTEIMTDPQTIEPRTAIEVTVDGTDLYNLLLRWVEEILYYFDSNGLLFREYKVKKIECKDNGCSLEAIMRGEKYNPEKHESRTHVKAATYAEMSIKKESGLWTLDSL
jgi:SHS2 domain-containing protein